MDESPGSNIGKLLCIRTFPKEAPSSSQMRMTPRVCHIPATSLGTFLDVLQQDAVNLL